MGLSTELILTLKNLKGFGTKTILKIYDSITNDISSIDGLCTYWSTLHGKTFEKVSSDDLHDAYKLAQKIINDSERNEIGIMSINDDVFPSILRECTNEDGKLDPPIILFYRGNLDALKKPGIAIIGTREPTPNGIKAGIYFAREYAIKGFNIVSGLAIGCDTAGHRGALDVNGTTTAFLANGLDWDSMYPRENLELAKEIVCKGGLLLSEYPIGQPCNRYALVARDRLQSGLSYATLAIQTGVIGGTMHAVNTTLKVHKPLFMIQYKHKLDLKSDKVQGNMKLISEGKAFALGRETFDKSLYLLKESINKINSSKIEQVLF